MFPVGRITYEELKRSKPHFVDSCNETVLRNLITAFNAVVEQCRVPIEDMSLMQSSILQYSQQSGMHLSDGPGTRGLLHCIIAFSLKQEMPQVAHWLNNIEDSMSKLASRPSWSRIRCGFQRMIHGNSIVSMAVEAHIGATLGNLGYDISMHEPGAGDVRVSTAEIDVCIEIKTKSGSFTRIADIDTSGLLDSDLDHPIIIREKRKPTSNAEVIEYAEEVLNEYRRGLQIMVGLNEEADTYQKYWHEVGDGKYIQRICIYQNLYRQGQGMIIGIISGDYNSTPDKEVKEWMLTRIFDANRQIKSHSHSQLNVVALMLPAHDLPLVRVEGDLVGFLGESLQIPNIDAIIVGEFRSIDKDYPSIGYACRYFNISSASSRHVALMHSLSNAISQRI